MSYTRLGPDSDVYVYQSTRGIECEENHADGKSVFFNSRLQAIDHLVLHRKAGQRVPDHVFGQLMGELNNEGDRVPEILSYIIPVDRTIEETFSMPDYRDAAEKERLMQVLDGIESVEPRVNRRFGPFEMTQYDDERIAWMQIGRFHLRVETSTVYAERSFVVGIGTRMMEVMFR